MYFYIVCDMYLAYLCTVCVWIFLILYSFGNPHHDEKSILAPIRQCCRSVMNNTIAVELLEIPFLCRLRNSTWSVLQSVAKGPYLSNILDSSMKRDVLYPILTTDHLQAIDRRLNDILRTVEHCVMTHGQNIVLVDG